MAIVFQHHTAWSGHGTAIDHHIAGDDQPGAAVGPALIKVQQRRRGRVVGVGHVFLHRGLGDAVVDDGARRQGQRREQGHRTAPGQGNGATLTFKFD
ncbi:hypothetical protein G6F63_014038 [Rhizopus arrhizus]|nr:hypothetical protein G6F31_014889 [Rhizopus arrhizus]KAG1320896.1 hypothetical protein G6F63_014038 [Rhizopus arrhizus]